MKFLGEGVGPLAAIVTTLATIQTASAHFVIRCSGPLVRDRLDPIVNPGKVSGHLHTLSGGNAFDAEMTYEDAISSSCTSCNVKQDLSNYWTPDLWARAKNGSFHPVENGGHIVYYLDRSEPGETFTPFPKGFRMLAGDPMLRSFNKDSVAQGAIEWTCINDQGYAPTRGFPSHKCGQLRADIHFPSCWDGKNLDSPDHKSHVSYPVGHWEHGPCPATHPVRLIHLFYELYIQTHPWDSEWDGDKHPFVLSNGDPTGYSLHGDFLNGWDIPTLDKAINGCKAPIASVEDCPFLTVNPPSAQGACRIPQKVDEEIDGWLPQLPGCNPVQTGPAKAVAPPTCQANTVVGAGKKYYADMSSKGWGYVGCAIDSLENRLFSERKATDDMTIEQCIDHCTSKSFSLSALQYYNECWCGNTLDKSKLTSDPNCNTPCKGNPNQFCGGPQRSSVYQKGKTDPAIDPDTPAPVPPKAVAKPATIATPKPATPTPKPVTPNTTSTKMVVTTVKKVVVTPRPTIPAWCVKNKTRKQCTKYYQSA